MTQKVMTNDEAVTGAKHILLKLTFKRETPNLTSTFDEKFKKVKKKFHPP
jgi:hypothetical protein